MQKAPRNRMRSGQKTPKISTQKPKMIPKSSEIPGIFKEKKPRKMGVQYSEGNLTLNGQKSPQTLHKK